VTATMKIIYLRALRIKFEQGIAYEDTLGTWTKLTEDEKQELLGTVTQAAD
jgi:hypothetical protein